MNTKKVTLTKNRIEIDFPFDWDMMQRVREITDRGFDRKRKIWFLPASPWHADAVINTLGKDGFIIDARIVELARGEKIDPILKYFDGLYDFQKVALDFIGRSRGRCILADDMGTGKTIEALAYVRYQKDATVLVVCPANVLYKWAAECEKWIPGRKVQIVLHKTDKLRRADGIIYIMSYAIMVSKFEELKLKGVDILIGDEAHYLKSYKVQRTRVARALIRDGITNILFLSGTPFMNRPGELFTLLNMLNFVEFPNYKKYALRYCGPIKYQGAWHFPPNGISNSGELAERLKRYMIRRTKREILSDLPDMTRTSIPVDISNEKEYHAARKDVATWLASVNLRVVNPAHVLTRLNILRQVCGMGKVNAAIELADSVLNSGDQVVLFAHHLAVVSKMEELLHDYRVGVITGEVPAKHRQELINRFLEKELDVMIITTAGAEGIDLYSASNIIFVEREWTPAREEQAEARLHRIGQKNPVNSYYLVARGTVDEKLNKVVEAKRKIIGLVIAQDEIIETIVTDLVNKRSVNYK